MFYRTGFEALNKRHLFVLILNMSDKFFSCGSFFVKALLVVKEATTEISEDSIAPIQEKLG